MPSWADKSDTDEENFLRPACLERWLLSAFVFNILFTLFGEGTDRIAQSLLSIFPLFVYVFPPLRVPDNR